MRPRCWCSPPAERCGQKVRCYILRGATNSRYWLMPVPTTNPIMPRTGGEPILFRSLSDRWRLQLKKATRSCSPPIFATLLLFREERPFLWANRSRLWWLCPQINDYRLMPKGPSILNWRCWCLNMAAICLSVRRAREGCPPICRGSGTTAINRPGQAIITTILTCR